MAKDKKKTKDKKNKKTGKTASLASAPKKPAKRAPKKASKSLKGLKKNPLVADVVAATLVAMASALKDSDKARRLASEAGDELNALAKKSAKQGNAMWDLALDVGRRALDALSDDGAPRGKSGKSR